MRELTRASGPSNRLTINLRHKVYWININDPSTFEVFPAYYISKAIVLVLGLGVMFYAYFKK